jgi:hypothetical protein
MKTHNQQTQFITRKQIRSSLTRGPRLHFAAAAHKHVPRLVCKVAFALLAACLSATSADAGVAVSIGQNFTGQTSSQASGENPSLGVNKDYVVESGQLRFAVYNKANGSVVQAMDMSGFWTNAGVVAPPFGNGSRVVFDPTVQRWFAAAIVPPNLRVAVSETADPTGTWHGVTLPDRPGSTDVYHFNTVFLGLDAQGVYLSSLIWPVNGDGYVPSGTALWSLPRADLLSIPPIVRNRTWFGQLFATNYGYSLVPAIAFDGSTGGNMLATASAGVDPIMNGPETNNMLVALAIQNAAGPGLATLSATQTVLVPPYTEPGWPLQPPDGAADLTDGDAELTAQVYRVGDVLFAAHATQFGPRVAVRWYRLSAINNALLESGTITDPGLDFYFPSIAANTNGTVVLAFNGSGSDTPVGCYAMVGQTVNGVTTFGNLLLLQPGLAGYQNTDPSGNNEWGAYSTTCVDPTDPNVFWTINMYAADTATWATQITQLLTSPSPQLSIANSGTNLLLSWPVTAVPFALWSSPSLSGNASWSAVSAMPMTNGATISVTMPSPSAGAFFRLVASQ